MGINTETVAFIGFLNKLAKMSEDDIHPFSTVTPDNKKGLFTTIPHLLMLRLLWIIMYLIH